MTFFSFSSSGKDRRKTSKQHKDPNPYGYSHGPSTITLHRPVPPPFMNGPGSPPPNQPWGSPPPQQYATAPQPYPPARPPRPQANSPPNTQVYGSPPQNNGIAWASSTNLPNPVYPSSGGGEGRKPKYKSSVNLTTAITDPIYAASASVADLENYLHSSTSHYLDSGNALYDRMTKKLDNVISDMDEEKFSGNEKDLELVQTSTNASRSTQNLSSKVYRTNHFAKVWQYSNSRLPPYLPPVRLYLDTYPLLSTAARYSLNVYNKPRSSERNDHVKESRATGTKAMVVKSLALDDKNCIVFAIRGTSTFMDWAVNVRESPTAPVGFIDNDENFCHAGFLECAKAMVKPVADRLRTLLAEDSARTLASLVITGHSAGGAVAQLLYAHMTSMSVQSELTHLVSFFKRVHCITFGAPPVTLLPLQHPKGRQHRKSMFFAFANEGDPVVRADRAIVKSLLKLYAVPAPDESCKVICPIVNAIAPGFVPPRVKKKKSMAHLEASSWSGPEAKMADREKNPPWKVPMSTLSLGGRIVLMRERFGGSGADDLETCSVTDEMLREVVYGDPMAHSMVLYARRIDILATKAATGRGFG